MILTKDQLYILQSLHILMVGLYVFFVFWDVRRRERLHKEYKAKLDDAYNGYIVFLHERKIQDLVDVGARPNPFKVIEKEDK